MFQLMKGGGDNLDFRKKESFQLLEQQCNCWVFVCAECDDAEINCPL